MRSLLNFCEHSHKSHRTHTQNSQHCPKAAVNNGPYSVSEILRLISSTLRDCFCSFSLSLFPPADRHIIIDFPFSISQNENEFFFSQSSKKCRPGFGCCKLVSKSDEMRKWEVCSISIMVGWVGLVSCLSRIVCCVIFCCWQSTKDFFPTLRSGFSKKKKNPFDFQHPHTAAPCIEINSQLPRTARWKMSNLLETFTDSLDSVEGNKFPINFPFALSRAARVMMCVRRLVSQIFSVDSADEYDTESHDPGTIRRCLESCGRVDSYKFLRPLLIKNFRAISQNADLNWIMCCWQRQSSSYFMVESRVWVREKGESKWRSTTGSSKHFDIFMLICDSFVLWALRAASK